MTKMVFVSEQTQLDLMEVIACASGATHWDSVREEMSEALREQHGRQVDFDYEPISSRNRNSFIAWLQEGETE